MANGIRVKLPSSSVNSRKEAARLAGLVPIKNGFITTGNTGECVVLNGNSYEFFIRSYEGSERIRLQTFISLEALCDWLRSQIPDGYGGTLSGAQYTED